jgi:menaquinone-specific isochorismate synthase
VSIAPLGTAGTGSRVRTRAIPALDRPIELLPDERGPLCWVRGSEGLVGWGEVARFTAGGPGRFEAADAWWRDFSSRLDVVDEVGMPGTGAVAFASFAFAADPGESVLVVPRVVVGTRDGVGWITEIGEVSGRMHQVSPVRPPLGVTYADGRLPVARWRQAVAEAVRRMRGGELRKAVFAHDLMATADEPLDPRYLLSALAEQYPTCWCFAVDGLVGATPELLLRREGGRVASRVLAGTRWPSQDGGGTGYDTEAGDAGSALLASAKDREEHRYAVDSLLERLRPLCTDVRAPAEPSLLRLRNLMHLSSDVTATLDPARAPSLLRLADAVHPTAAVGGTPREPALRLIAELEDMDRGRYSGPVGWVDAEGDGELGLALRCAQVSGSTARLFAGCGVVADSDPDTEVREAAAKLVPIRQALEGAPDRP